MPLTKNTTHTTTIRGYTSDGEGVARIDGQVVFVKGAIDGETCTVRILRTAKSVAWAKIEAVITPSPHRITPVCPAFGPCGGCDFLHMDYAEELRLKHQRVTDALTRVGGLDVPVHPILAAERQTHYRNKAIFTVGDGPVTGFYRRRSHQIIPVDTCLIQSESANKAAAALREWMTTYNIQAYTETAHTGLIRNLFVREARSTGKIAVCIVATKGGLPHETALIDTIRRHCPEAASITLCVNTKPTNVVLQGNFRTLWGDDYLTDTLCGLHFRLSPRSFFQVNPAQAERLYGQALAYADLGGTETVLDLYCGTGTITLLMAKHAKHAVGAEIVPEATRDANENARINGISNAEFILADAAVAAETLKTRGRTPDVVVVDPPRKGLAPEVVEQIAEMMPERIVYVSCDPATLARDLKLFATLGYGTREVTPVDMFPRCAHVECVAWIAKDPP
ncbi:MAG: 23S rRNA (uracil(1939)-C(5))-methyltransferase RlmD [Oscillospiraceae bacterium]|nr:23S rRNA (uracil(1939)-C(5))-methyltransferase RlmD [Oscillospiraceae bacterium]